MFNSITLMFGKEKLSKLWAGLSPIVLLYQPEAAESLLSSQNATQKADHYRFLQPWLGDGLVTSKNPKWKQRRKMLTPTFHLRILQDFRPIFNEHANLLIHQIDQIALDQPKEPKMCFRCRIHSQNLIQDGCELTTRNISGSLTPFTKFDKTLPEICENLSRIENKFTNECKECFNQCSALISKRRNQLKQTQEMKDSKYDCAGSVDVVPIMTNCTLGVICETAMGIRLHERKAGEDQEYVQCLHQISQLFVCRITRPWLWFDWLYRLTPESRCFNRCLRVMKQFTTNVIQQRREDWLEHLKDQPSPDSNQILNVPGENLIKRSNKIGSFLNSKDRKLAFLDLLLQHHFQNPKAFTVEDIREEVDTFMFAVS